MDFVIINAWIEIFVIFSRF